MKRRDFVRLLGGAGIAPFAARAQRPGKMRRIAMLLGQTDADVDAQSRLLPFKETLAQLGWTEGRNLSIEVRWSGGDIERAAVLARELVAEKPELIVCTTTPVTAALQRETRTIPIIFTAVSDPIGSGFVRTLSQPGGNITGFINLEPSLIEKCLELLKQIAPRVTRVAVMFNPNTAPYAEGYLRRLSTAAPKLRVKVFTAPVRSASDIEEAITGLGRAPGSGLIIMPDSFFGPHRKLLIALAAGHKVPTTYFAARFVSDGGLSSYGPDVVDLWRRPAFHVDRILRGAKPAELPVQQPSTFELAINLKTAKALGITISHSIMVRAEKVIE
ncbi:MAG: transporter substrate binding protein [Betaproteobacteria bacterium]|nr:transporter substrate binding protein [Betaproteobacteria bacterium]